MLELIVVFQQRLKYIQSRIEYKGNIVPKEESQGELLPYFLWNWQRNLPGSIAKHKWTMEKPSLRGHKQEIGMPSPKRPLSSPTSHFHGLFFNMVNPRILWRMFSLCGRNVSSIYGEHMLSSNKSLERRMNVTIEMAPFVSLMTLQS